MGRRRRGLRPGGIAVLAAVVSATAAGAAGMWLAQSNRPASTVVVPGPPPARTVQQRRAPAPSAVPTRSAGVPEPPHVQTPGRADQRVSPRVPAAFRAAIIFDDAGSSADNVEEIIAIGRPVAIAILPALAYSAEVARRARAGGLEILLHLPVESADEAKALGPGGVTVTMTDAEIHAAVRSGLASVPGAVGVNTHMGSKGTADRRVMRAVIEVVREAGLFFIDSRTTTDTVAEAVAADMGVRTAARAVFLDNENEGEAIRAQLRRLITLAKERGSAIAIGHVRRLTAGVLANMLDEFDRAGVAIVPLSTLVR